MYNQTQNRYRIGFDDAKTFVICFLANVLLYCG